MILRRGTYGRKHANRRRAPLFGCRDRPWCFTRTLISIQHRTPNLCRHCRQGDSLGIWSSRAEWRHLHLPIPMSARSILYDTEWQGRVAEGRGYFLLEAATSKTRMRRRCLLISLGWLRSEVWGIALKQNRNFCVLICACLHAAGLQFTAV